MAGTKKINHISLFSFSTYIVEDRKNIIQSKSNNTWEKFFKGRVVFLNN